LPSDSGSFVSTVFFGAGALLIPVVMIVPVIVGLHFGDWRMLGVMLVVAMVVHLVAWTAYGSERDTLIAWLNGILKA